MRDALVVFVAIILAIVIGGYLYMNGGPKFSERPATELLQPKASFTVIAEGQDSGAVDRRTNYRITNYDDLAALWSLIYASGGQAVPSVDFSKDEVIAVFDGSHSSGGYKVSVTEVTDADGKRTVHILRESPDSDCPVTEAITSPFQIILVSRTAFSLVKEEQMRTRICGSY